MDEATFNAAGPGYMAYIPGGGLVHAAIADLIAGADKGKSKLVAHDACLPWKRAKLKRGKCQPPLPLRKSERLRADALAARQSLPCHAGKAVYCQFAS